MNGRHHGKAGTATRRLARCCAGLALVVALGGCAARYFQPAPTPPEVPRHALAAWPYAEYWTGIVFNGERVGYAHLALAALEDEPGRFRIRSEAAMRFRFLMLDKRVTLTAEDIVDEGLRLLRFTYDYDIDGSRLHLEGAVDGNTLHVRIDSTGQRTEERLALQSPVYPTSATALYPALHGLEVGRSYRYPVYNGETRAIAQATQEILGYETSDLYAGSAWRICTRLAGFEATTWMDARARPLLERSMNGVVIAHLEPREQALRYLAAGVLQKREALLDLSLVPVEPALQSPRALAGLTVALAGVPEDFAPPAGDRQRCRREGAAALVCEIRTRATAASRGARPADLASSLAIPADHTVVRRLAATIAGSAADPAARIAAIVDWMLANVRREPNDVFTALDVLERGAAECQGQTWLYAALARALGIPTRVVNGLVYSEAHRGFLYHTWAESLAGEHWIAVDPTFGQVPADATHLVLVEGERLEDLAPIAGLIGRLRARVLDAHPATPEYSG